MIRIPLAPLLCILAISVLALASCSGPASLPSTSGDTSFAAGNPVQDGWPTTLPQDGVQPWETVGSGGIVADSQESRLASALNLDSEFTSGDDYFEDGGSVSMGDGFLGLTSGPAGSSEISFATYRLVMGGLQPGIISTDINLHARSDGSLSDYWVGVADFGSGAWTWHGPFKDSHVRIDTAGSDLLSGLGNAFVAIIATGGSEFDIVGIAATPREASDTTAPPIPSAPVLTPVNGGMLVEWVPVVAADLAGYEILYSFYSFTDENSPSVKSADYLEGNTSHVITGISGPIFVRLRAVDISGNYSSVSDVSWAVALAGPAMEVTLEVDAVSGMIGNDFNLTASGAASYDFDFDGDGLFEVTGNASGTATYTANEGGIIRPAVRGTDGTSFAQGAVSLIVSGNSRPVARAYADPAQGPAPLAVTLTGQGTDYDGSIDQYAWDFDGDGVYDLTSVSPSPASPVNYNVPGLYNAKLRVRDDKGATDVDTITINALKYAGFGGSLVDSDPFGEEFPALAMVDGRPAVAYWDSQFNNLQYRRALDPEGRIWGAPVDITLAGSSGTYVALAVVAGKPAVAYLAPGPNEIHYQIADDAEGTAWTAPPVTLSIVPTSTNYPLTMGVVANNPAVAWQSSGPGHLIYRRASSAAGTGETAADWSDPPATIDNSGSVSGGPELSVINGNPAVAYFNGAGPGIYYKRAVNNTGALAADWPGVAINCTPGLPISNTTNLAEVEGRPAITYTNFADETLVLMRALDADGAAWPAGGVAAIDYQGQPTPNYFDLAIVGGLPAIAFQGTWPNQKLWYVQATSSDGSTWGPAMLACPLNTDSNGSYCRIVDNNGLPCMIHKNNSWSILECSYPVFE